ncbi:MAG: hypothetical protein AAF950_17010 [Pseudomonadota bacterium]
MLFRRKLFVLTVFSAVSAACAHNGAYVSHDFQTERLLGGAVTQNIAAQSIRPVDLPNSEGLQGQSGIRAVAAITRLNSREPAEISDASASGVGSSVDSE